MSLAKTKKSLSSIISLALQSALGLSAEISFDRPKNHEHGDLACNIAFRLTKQVGISPDRLAQLLVDKLKLNPDFLHLCEKVDIANGYLNFTLAQSVKSAVLADILSQGSDYGVIASSKNSSAPILVEFVSANPTGPLHVGHARQAVLGDVLSNILASQGSTVSREFYYNDEGVQIATLTNSVIARANGLAPGDVLWPEDAYNGDYVLEIAQNFLATKPVEVDGEALTPSGNIVDTDNVRRYAVACLRREQLEDLSLFGLSFDNFYMESSLYRDGHVEALVDNLKASGKTYELDNKLWLKTTDFGDDKDRVMVKSDGTFTYFVPDVAYHLQKWQRGFADAINIQGYDHQGTVARVRAGLQALSCGIPETYPQYILHKMVKVMKGGKEVKVSKRAGGYVTLRDLVEMSGGGNSPEQLVRGRDVVRFFMASRKAETEFLFDIDLAQKSTEENPVYYVQYAHARICSVLRESSSAVNVSVDYSKLTHKQECRLLQKLAEYPEMLANSADTQAPHEVVVYLRDLASLFHSVYNVRELRVLTADDDIRAARLDLYKATAQVLSNGLGLLGVSAPKAMYANQPLSEIKSKAPSI